MKESTRKIIMWVLLGLALLGSIFAVVFALGSDPKNVLEAGTMNELGNPHSGMYNIAYFILVAFVVVALGSILAFVVMKLISNFKENPKKATRSLLAVALLVVVVLVSYLLSSGTDVSQTLLDKNGLTQHASKWIGAACFTVYILFIAAVCAIVYVEIAKAFIKK